MQVKQPVLQAKHEVPERYLPSKHDRHAVPLQAKQPVLQAKHEVPERYLSSKHDRQLVEVAP